jgi:ubiquinone/menaquinone biosynthesis C-methylase UbiE
MQDPSLQQRTRAHYEAHPFDFLSESDEKNIQALQPRPFLHFVRQFLRQGMTVAEIGCGPGRGTLFLAQCGVDLTAVDLSSASLQLARRRAPGCCYIQASNLALPLPSGYFDAVVSDGVIHHTPDPFASFAELARLLVPGGLLYLGVYRRRRYYYYLYTWLGRPVRWLAARSLGKALVHATLLPVYHLVHLVKSRGTRSWKGSRNFFYDYILTPQATFHTREEIVDWGTELGLQLLDYDEHVGNVHAFIFRKSAETE